MSKFLRAAAVVAMVVLGAAVAQAQTVGMAGEYSESNGIIIQIPQNPPNTPCTYGDDARCIRNEQHFFGTTVAPPISLYPQQGVPGAQNIATIGGTGTRPNGLNVGDPFLVPPLAFQQRLGTQVGIVLNNVTLQLDTTFTPAAPGAARASNAPALTRQFSAMNWSAVGNGHNNNAGTAPRLAAATTITRTIANETLAMTYTPGANEFGGTMTILLDGTGRLYLGGAQINGLFPTSLQPIVGTNPVGDGIPGFATRNAAGWNYTVMGTQMAGRFKAYGPGVGVFPPIPTQVIGPACAATPPPSPAGCNEINGFDTFGVTVAPLPGATSVKHMFAWTTGTVQIVRTAVRNGGAVTLTDTATGMGYDTITTGTGGTLNRNVGMVAGSYTTRTDGVPLTQMNTQMVGIDLKFTPEPGATVALISGLGLLGTLAARRRR